MQGKSWDVIEIFCSKPAKDMTYKSRITSEAVSPNIEHAKVREVSKKGGGLSVITTALIVIGVLLVCAICGGLILAKVVKRLRNRSKTPEYCDVYAARATNISTESYADVVSGPSYISVESDTYVGSDRSIATGYAYVAVQ
jgi:hypothetical protein